MTTPANRPHSQDIMASNTRLCRLADDSLTARPTYDLASEPEAHLPTLIPTSFDQIPLHRPSRLWMSGAAQSSFASGPDIMIKL